MLDTEIFDNVKHCNDLTFREKQRERQREGGREKKRKREREQTSERTIHALCCKKYLIQKLFCNMRYDSEYKICHPFVPASNTFFRSPHIVRLRIKIYILDILYRYSLRCIKARYFSLTQSSYLSKYSIKYSQQKEKIYIMMWTASYS